MATSTTAKPSSAIVSPLLSSSSASSAAAASRQKTPTTPRPKSQNEAIPAIMQEGTAASRHAHDRLTFLVANFVGYMASITVKNGEQYSGVFAGATMDVADAKYLLKMSKRIAPSSPSQSNGIDESTEEYAGYGDEHVMTFDVKDVVDLNVRDVSIGALQPKLSNGASFRTDTDISGNLALRERELQRWEPSTETNIDLSMNGSSRGTWDQFEVNERLYGVKTDYDENLYTTALDRSHPTYKQRAAEADRLAREIESSTTTNTHVAEERNLKSPEEEDGGDEEEKYSGVKRDMPPLVSSQSHNKYTPPARRAPTGQPTVPGAPVDPAIISSQLVRPGSNTIKASKATETSTSTSQEIAMKENANPVSSALEDLGGETGAESEENNESFKEVKSDEAVKTAGESPSAASTRSTTLAPSTTSNATANVERQVADAFKSFAASEKMWMQEKQREKQRLSAKKERESRLNDLKKFSANFKLPTAPPEDILGILARDKAKQVEIVGKAKRELEEQKAAQAASQEPPASESSDSRAAADNQASEGPTPPVGPANDRSGTRAPRSAQMVQTFHGGRKADRNAQALAQNNMPVSTPRAPGHLGERLLAQQQFRNARPYQNMQPQMQAQDPRISQQQPAPQAAPSAINADVVNRRHSGIPTPNSAIRFNAQASEFRPNPTATSFLPGTEESSASTSPTRGRSRAAKKPVNRVSFFAGKKPAEMPKKSIADAFNPIPRLKREAAEAGKTKDFTANGGIPQAYRTPPTWEPGEGNADKSYVDMFENASASAPSVSPGSFAMAHQHQLPPHLQHGSHVPSQMHTPQQQYRMNPNGQPRDAYFDDHRMHPSSSQHSSVGPSPSFRQPMLAYPPQMGIPVQPQFVQNVGQFQLGPNGQPVTPMRPFPAQFVNPQGVPMAAPMMTSHSNGGQFLGFPGQGQVPMYSPGGHQVFPAQMNMPHAGGQGGFPSPRTGAPMMAHQGSQGHGVAHYMVPGGPNQQGGPGSFGKQQSNQMHMRGGVPMMQQGSYGSPHLQHHFPAQQRGGGPQYGPGNMNFGYQQVQPPQMMQFPQGQQHPPSGPMRRPSEQSDVK